MVIVKTKTVTLAVLLCFYAIFVFSINPSIDEFAGMSLEVTDQNDGGVFSSLSRNFEQTIEEINAGDEKSDSSSNTDEKSRSSTSTDSSSSGDEKSRSSTSTDSSSSGDEKSMTSNVPAATSGSSDLVNSNSTTNDDLGKKNQTNFIE